MRAIRNLLCVLLALAFGTEGYAATAAGVIVSIDADTGTLTIDVTTSKGQVTKSGVEYKLDAQTKTTLDGKAAQVADLVAGQKVTVTTSTGNKATRIAAKSAPAGTAATSAGEANTGWHQYGGPNRDNISTETGLLDSWPQGGPELKWTASGLGEGYSSVALADGKILTMGNRGQDEMTICLDEKTGKEIWATATGKAYRENMGNGPRSTPTIDGKQVFVLGGNGDLACMNLANGKKVWGGNILQEFGAKNIVWGISESVLIDGPNLVFTPGGPGAAMVCVDKQNGKIKWKAACEGNPQTGYSSILPVDFEGTRLYVNFVHTALIAVDAKTGKVLWENQSPANGTANCSSPVASEGIVFAASGYGTGGTAIKLSSNGNKIEAEQLYHTKEMKSHHGGMVLRDGYVYGTDEGVLTCIELKSGRVAWQNRSVGKGAVVYAEGQIILRSENGPVALFKATPQGYEETGRFEPSRSQKPAWPHPVVANGCLYLRDQDQLMCYKLK